MNTKNGYLVPSSSADVDNLTEEQAKNVLPVNHNPNPDVEFHSQETVVPEDPLAPDYNSPIEENTDKEELTDEQIAHLRSLSVDSVGGSVFVDSSGQGSQLSDLKQPIVANVSEEDVLSEFSSTPQTGSEPLTDLIEKETAQNKEVQEQHQKAVTAQMRAISGNKVTQIIQKQGSEPTIKDVHKKNPSIDYNDHEITKPIIINPLEEEKRSHYYHEIVQLVSGKISSVDNSIETLVNITFKRGEDTQRSAVQNIQKLVELKDKNDISDLSKIICVLAQNYSNLKPADVDKWVKTGTTSKDKNNYFSMVPHQEGFSNYFKLLFNSQKRKIYTTLATLILTTGFSLGIAYITNYQNNELRQELIENSQIINNLNNKANDFTLNKSNITTDYTPAEIAQVVNSFTQESLFDLSQPTQIVADAGTTDNYTADTNGSIDNSVYVNPELSVAQKFEQGYKNNNVELVVASLKEYFNNLESDETQYAIDICQGILKDKCNDKHVKYLTKNWNTLAKLLD